MKKLNNQGFAHAGLVLLVVVVIAGVGGTGYYVWNKNNKSTDLTTSIQEKAASANNQNSNKTCDTKEVSGNPYASPKGYTVNLPDGWKLESDATCQTLYAAEYSNLTYKSGVDTTVNQGISRGASYDVFSLTLDPGKPFDVGQGEKQSSFKTSSGDNVDRYVYDHVFDEGAQDFGFPKQAEETQWLVTHGSQKIRIVSSFTKGLFLGQQHALITQAEYDRINTYIEQSIKTIQFK